MKELLRLSNERRWARFPPGLLARLALLPEWSVELAVSAGLGDSAEILRLLDQLEEAGLIDRRIVLTAHAMRGEVFWIRPRQRALLASYLREREDLDLHLKYLKRILRGYKKSGSGLLSQWFDIVNRYHPEPSGLALIREVDRLVYADRMAEATSLVVAARSLGDLVGGTLADTVRRAQWRLDRAHRARQDKRYLDNYVNRRDIEESIRELLQPDNEQWALHLIGSGGVGKTMTIRYLASGRFAADHRMSPFPVARLDFDDLDPRYPEERPAELLLSLVGELVGYGKSRNASERLRDFDDRAKLLHTELSRAQPDHSRIDEVRREVASKFALFLSQLEGNALLVIDTCEELAKLYPPGAAAPAINETFRMLEAVHDAAPDVRVLLAGRRRLTPSDDILLKAAGPVLVAREFLAVHEVRGYTPAEAEAYLDQTHPSVELRAAILRHTRDETGRHRPFELTTYAEWAKADPDLAPEVLGTDSNDPYVERRVLARLARKVRDALPIAVALGRFDLRLITPGLRRLGLESDRDWIFGALAAQEWVNVIGLDPSGQPHVLEVAEHLRSRIRNAVEGQVDLSHLGHDAVAAIAETPLAEVPTETVEAAVRWLQPDQAAVWWDELERRISLERAWAWASQVTIRVAAVALERPTPHIAAAVLATHASARLHGGHVGDLPQIWAAVEAQIEDHPDSRLQHVLRQRVSLGLIASGAGHDDLVLPDLTDAPADAIIASADCLLTAGSPLPAPIVNQLRQVERHDDVRLAATAHLLFAGHLLHRTSEPWAMGGMMGEALGRSLLAAEASTGLAYPPAGSYRDWIYSPRLNLRCWQAVLLLAASTNDVRLNSWASTAWILGRSASDDVDGDRLSALALDCDMRIGLPPVDRIVANVYQRMGPATGWTSRYTRPLQVSVAEAQWLLGEPEQAAARLHRQIYGAYLAGDDPETIDACQLALLRLCRQYRTFSYLTSATTLSMSGSFAIRAEAWLLRALVRGDRPATPDEAGSLYAWARCQDEETVSAHTPLSRVGEAATPRLLMAATFRVIGEIVDEPRLDPAAALRPEVLAEAMRYWIANGKHIAERLARRTRHSGPDPTPALVGHAALEAGEVIALQSPHAAVGVLDFAVETLAAVDPAAAARASALAAITCRRLGDKSRSVNGDQLKRLDSADHGWRVRADALRGKVPHNGSGSPELAWAIVGARAVGLRTFVRKAYLIAPHMRNNQIVVHPFAWALAVVSLSVVIVYLATSPDPGLFALAGLVYGSLLLWTFFTTPFRVSVAIQIRPKSAEKAVLMLRRHLGLTELHNGVLRTTPKNAWRRSSAQEIWIGTENSITPRGFEAIASSRRSRRSLVQLEVARELENRPWERRLGSQLNRPRRKTALFFRREAGRYPTAPLKRWLRSKNTWPGFGRNRSLHADSLIDLEKPTPIAAIMVGTPVETYAGYRIRVSSAEGLAETALSEVDDTGLPLVDPSQHVINRTGLVVLIGEPIDDPAQPPWDLMAAFLAVSRPILEANVGAVLIVPPMPDKVVRQVSVLVRRHLVRTRLRFLKRPRPHHVLKLLAAIKRLAGDEAALDVLLTMRTYGPIPPRVSDTEG